MTWQILVCCFLTFAHRAEAKSASDVTASNAKGSPPTKATASVPTKPKSGRNSVVVAPETAIYERPDLDSPIIVVLPQGVRIPVSKGTRGQYAKFYRTRFKGRMGWVLTIDVKPEAVVRKAIEASKKRKPPKGPFAGEEEGEEQQEKQRDPFAFAQSVSFVVGYSQYIESVAGADRSANLITYGLKVTGPDVLIQGPLIDFNLIFHYGAPDYYSALSATKPAGFLMWTDACLLLPLRMREDSLIGVAAGPLLVMSNIQASQGAQNFDMFSLNIGLTTAVSAAMRFDDFALRIEGRYLFEKKSYYQVQASLGTTF